MGTSSISINTNLPSLNAQRRLSQNSAELRRSLERLSSGLRINHAVDDAAGLSVATVLQAESRLHAQGIRNANDAISALAIAESSALELSGIVTRIMELAEQSSNGVLGTAQRTAIDREAQALAQEYERISSTTTFNNIGLLNQASLAMPIQVGTNGDASSQVHVVIEAQAGHLAGDGTFAAAPRTFSVWATTGIVAGDMNNDGLDDLVTWHDGLNIVSVVLANGDGTFKAEKQFTAYVEGNARMQLSDVNNDGNLDFVGPSGDSAAVLLGNQDGSFKAVRYYTVNSGQSSWCVTPGDFNNDGKPDLIADDGNSGGKVYLLAGNGDGTFRHAVSASSKPAGGLQAAVGDINGDSRLDTVFADGQVLLGNGDGTFIIGSSVSGGDRSPVLADFNHDGKLDFAATGAGGLTTADVYLGAGNGTFGSASHYTIGVTDWVGFMLSAADFNGDGAADLLGAASGDGTLSVLLNNGDGSFKVAQSYTPAGSNNAAVTIGDVTGDGVLDIATCEYGGDTISVFVANSITQGGLPEFSLRTRADARLALESMGSVLSRLGAGLGAIGAQQSRLATATANSSVLQIGTASAASQILDSDVALESANLVRTRILQQASQAILAQANLQPKIAIFILGNT